MFTACPSTCTPSPALIGPEMIAVAFEKGFPLQLSGPEVHALVTRGY